MIVDFHSSARKELREAVAWYEKERSGLGIEFLSEVRGDFDLIARFPEAWKPLGRGRRCRVMDRFPYLIIYEAAEPNTIRIVAIAHSARKSGYWNRRR